MIDFFFVGSARAWGRRIWSSSLWIGSSFSFYSVYVEVQIIKQKTPQSLAGLMFIRF